MLRHLRLARARGSLVAPNHPLQDRALEVLLLLDEIQREERRVDMVKGLLTSQTSAIERVKAHFPEYFKPEDPYEAGRQEDGTYDIDQIDETELDWDTPASPDEDDDLSRWIAQREHSISVAEMDQYDN